MGAGGGFDRGDRGMGAAMEAGGAVRQGGREERHGGWG